METPAMDCFNPRTPEGAKAKKIRIKEARQCFNPRTPEGANTIIRVEGGWVDSFNPRTPEGANAQLFAASNPPLVSIHAPLRVRMFRRLLR